VGRQDLRAVEGLDVSCAVEVGEVLSIADPRLHDCAWPEGLTLTAHVIEVDPVVVRVRVTTHRLCNEAADEAAQVRRVWRRAVAKARQAWGPEFTVETVRGECSTDVRSADVDVLETR
jgi:hypothetical protein